MIPEKNRIRIEKYVTGIVNDKMSFAEEYDQFLKYYQEKIR
jgi:hypothetical protein